MKKANRPKIEAPKRSPDSHKGQNGLVLVIGGSEEYVGAPALAGLAALRSGCDLVNIAAPEKAAWAINALSPDLITTKLKGSHITSAHAKRLTTLSRKSDTVLIGPGISRQDKRFINTLIKSIAKQGKPIVIDADAVKVADMKHLNNTIITPHAREFELFLESNKHTFLITELRNKSLSEDKKIRIIQNNLDDFLSKGNIILLKGKHDLIISRKKSMISKGGNAGMTVGGTGDVLAGLCAGYLAQTADLFMSAGLASHNCKKIGSDLKKRSNFGFGFIASDFLREIKKLPKQAS
jgi:NAD(P)H-hydrate epimerase